MNSYLPQKRMQTITKVCGQLEELVNVRMKYSILHVIPLFLVLSANTFYNFWAVVMALAPHYPPLPSLHQNQTFALPHIPTYSTLSVDPIISLSKQWMFLNETKPWLTSNNVRVLEETLPTGTIPGSVSCRCWGCYGRWWGWSDGELLCDTILGNQWHQVKAIYILQTTVLVCVQAHGSIFLVGV